MQEFVVRCSSLGKLMGEPRNVDQRLRTPEVDEIIAKRKRSDAEIALLQSLKNQTLSEAAKAYVRSLAREAIFGVPRVFTSKQTEKGTRVEDDSIALYNSVFFTNHEKNRERRTLDGLTGECDILADEIIDIKSSWSIHTFPIVAEDAADFDYEWQVRGYMRLWDRPRAKVAYCLVDTPEDLIGHEPEEDHIVGHIPEHFRVTTWAVERDLELEALMVQKIAAARRYYAEVLAEFDRLHNGDEDEESLEDTPPWAQDESAAAAAPAAPALRIERLSLPDDIFA